jgi:cytochrome P450 family 26 subfamily A
MPMHYWDVVYVTFLALGVGAILVLRWRNGGRTSGVARLPPGSRGLPFLGETLHYLAASSTLGLLPPFFEKRLERYILLLPFYFPLRASFFVYTR